MPKHRAAIYARLSVSSDNSVSIERQIEACEKYAEAKGWEVVGTFKDDGVSASKNKPEDRAGWNELLTSPHKYDTVIVWRLDRFVRRIADFWRSYTRLQEDGRSLASVTESLDVTTTVGQMVATTLAGSAQMEVEATSARVKDAQIKLLRAGRSVGGTVPYGYRIIRNPNGPGKVLAQDPDTIGYVRGMVERIQQGKSIYSVAQWLTGEGAPTWRVVRAYRKAERDCSLREWLAEDGAPSPGTWAYNTVEGIIRNPILAGMVPFNRGGKPTTKHNRRGAEVLHGDDGLPQRNELLAIMSVSAWLAMLARLDAKHTGHSKPRDLRAKTSSLLSGMVWCGDPRHGPVRMHRCAEGVKRHGYTCPKCYQTITSFEDVVIKEFLRQKGERVRWTRVEHVYEGGAAVLPEIEHRLDELEKLIRDATDRDRRRELQEQQSNLLDLRDAKREEAPTTTHRYDDAGWFEDAWEAAGEDVEEQRAVLDDAIERIWVRRGRTGRRTEAQVLARLAFDWKVPEDLGPVAADG
jgi:site-specific DNA recombinase